MFVTSISIRRTFKSFWDLTEVSEQSWYKLEVLTYELVNPTFKISLIPKLLLRLLWFFRRTAALSRQICTFPQLFRFESILGNSGIWAYSTNCEKFNADEGDESSSTEEED